MAESTGGRHPLLRVTVYYLLLGVAALLLMWFAPSVATKMVSGSGIPTDAAMFSPRGTPDSAALQMVPSTSGQVSLTVILAMAVSSALMLPVVWVYIHTRQKKGYQQSLVQTVLMLPVVVSGVIILVKTSVALAFSLGGIVGAVAFRNRLEDTKDAVYVFLSIAIGLACGVLAFHIAISLSLFFNLVVLALWYTDFGRVPGDLSSPVAQRRVEAARGIVGEEGKHSGELVQVLDQQILQSMTPDQLQALVDRAKSRRKKIEEDLYGTKPRYERVLVVRAAKGASEDSLRETISAVLDREAKEWMLDSVEPDDDNPVFRYLVRTKKSVPEPLLLESIRRAAIPNAEDVSFDSK
jgi:hypothetical protein